MYVIVCSNLAAAAQNPIYSLKVLFRDFNARKKCALGSLQAGHRGLNQYGLIDLKTIGHDLENGHDTTPYNGVVLDFLLPILFCVPNIIFRGHLF